MKICPNCSAQNKDTDKFCQQCGQSIEGVEATTLADTAKDRLGKAGGAINSGVKKAQQTMEDMDKKRAEAKAAKVAAGGWDTATETTAYAPQTGSAPVSQNSILVDPSEQIVATIGNSYLQNFLIGGTVDKAVGMLTNKRFYYKGHNLSGTGKAMRSRTEEGTVSLDDIAYSGFIYTRPTGLLVAAIFFTLLIFTIPIALFFYIRYFTSRQTLFLVSFPGGGFAFDIKYYPIADIRDFQRQLHLLKDHRKEGAK